MNIFDKRDLILELQGKMLSGVKKKDNNFLSLVNFENWCCNSGLSGFVQDFKVAELKTINDFARENNFNTIIQMMSVVQKYYDQYGKDFNDKLNDEEYKNLCQYDNDFYDILDQYTDAIFRKYIKIKKQKKI